jgi:hypothetical protein
MGNKRAWHKNTTQTKCGNMDHDEVAKGTCKEGQSSLMVDM